MPRVLRMSIGEQFLTKISCHVKEHLRRYLILQRESVMTVCEDFRVRFVRIERVPIVRTVFLDF